MQQRNYHHHDQHTGGSHHHNHPHSPHTYVTTSRPPSRVVDYRSNYRPPYYVGGGSGGGVVFLIGSLIILPIFIVALILKLSVGAMGLTAASLTTAGVAASAIAFSAATFGIGALAVYGALGLGYLYSSAKECYSSDKNVFDMIKSRVVNEDGVSFKGVMKSIGSVLWTPFLLIGGLAGMGTKAIVNVCTSKSSNSKDISYVIGSGSYANMGSDFIPSQSTTEPKNDKPPVYSKRLFTAVEEDTEKNAHLLDSQTSFTPLYPSIYPTSNQ